VKPLVVVGAGPVGLAAAIAARRYGLPCVVIDKREPPLDKACGEGIMPAGVALLEWLGVTPAVSAPFTGIRYVDGATVLDGRLRSPGLGVRRTVLSAALLERARATGVELCFGVEARALRGNTLLTSAGEIEARCIVGADGLHSRVRARADIPVNVADNVRYGARQHYATPPWSNSVEVYWADGCEAYVTPVASDMVGVAVIGRGRASRFSDVIASFPLLAARLEGARVMSKLRGSGPMFQRVRRRHAGYVALVGDAAGYVDACTGEGLSIGFACARALAETIAGDRPLADYEERYRRITRRYYTLTRLMLVIAQRPQLRRRVIRTLARTPQIFDRIIAAHGS
jgi:flavin-dependent dehydrogenase